MLCNEYQQQRMEYKVEVELTKEIKKLIEKHTNKDTESGDFDFRSCTLESIKQIIEILTKMIKGEFKQNNNIELYNLADNVGDLKIMKEEKEEEEREEKYKDKELRLVRNEDFRSDIYYILSDLFDTFKNIIKYSKGRKIETKLYLLDHDWCEYFYTLYKADRSETTLQEGLSNFRDAVFLVLKGLWLKLEIFATCLEV